MLSAVRCVWATRRHRIAFRVAGMLLAAPWFSNEPRQRPDSPTRGPLVAAFEPAASHLAMVEIAFAGELDVAEEATMSAALEAAIPPGDPVCVVVDMSAVTFMDSTA